MEDDVREKLASTLPCGVLMFIVLFASGKSIFEAMAGGFGFAVGSLLCIVLFK